MRRKILLGLAAIIFIVIAMVAGHGNALIQKANQNNTFEITNAANSIQIYTK